MAWPEAKEHLKCIADITGAIENETGRIFSFRFDISNKKKLKEVFDFFMKNIDEDCVEIHFDDRVYNSGYCGEYRPLFNFYIDFCVPSEDADKELARLIVCTNINTGEKETTIDYFRRIHLGLN